MHFSEIVQNVSTPQEIELGSWFLAKMCKSMLQKKLQKWFLIFWEFPIWRPFLGEKLQFLWNFPIKIAAIMEILKISKFASVTFLTHTFYTFDKYFYTFWPKISILEFLEKLIHFVRPRRKIHLKFRSYGQTLIFLKIWIEISRERIKIF